MLHEDAVPGYRKALHLLRKVIRSVHETVNRSFRLYIFFRRLLHMHKTAGEPVRGINHKTGQNDSRHDQPFMDRAQGNPISFPVIEPSFSLRQGT